MHACMHVLSCMATGEQHKRTLICRHRLFGGAWGPGGKGGVGAGGDVAKRKHTQLKNNVGGPCGGVRGGGLGGWSPAQQEVRSSPDITLDTVKSSANGTHTCVDRAQTDQGIAPVVCLSSVCAVCVHCEAHE
jgi:hypothetical protein